MQDRPKKKRKVTLEVAVRITPSQILIDPCPSCGVKSEIRVIASAESSFMTKTLYLYKCANENCNYHIWSDSELRKNIGRRPHSAISPSYHGFHFKENPEDLHKCKFKEVLELPTKIITIYKAAYRCLTIDVYSSAAMELRKLMEHILIENGAKHGRKKNGGYISIQDMIKDVVEQGVLPAVIRDFCEDIRIFGGRGGHPHLKEITEAEAITAFHFVDFVVTWLYGNVKSY